MTKKNFHEIICPSCDSSFWINDAYSFFKKQQTCSNCKSSIPSGEDGLDEQIFIMLKRKALIRAIKLTKASTNGGSHSAKKRVKEVAKENNIKINTDVTPFVNFFVRLIFSGLLALALVGIGSIYYPKLQMIAAPIVCNGEFNIRVVEKLTTKEQGERSMGAVIEATCDDEDISKKTFYVSIGGYALIFFVLLTMRKIIFS